MNKQNLSELGIDNVDEIFNMLNSIITSPYDTHFRHVVTKKLREVENNVIGSFFTYGVEWLKNRYAYLNTGDTYNGTIIFDCIDSIWFVASWGDLYESEYMAEDQYKDTPDQLSNDFIGYSVSRATLRHCDLIQAFEDFLNEESKITVIMSADQIVPEYVKHVDRPDCIFLDVMEDDDLETMIDNLNEDDMMQISFYIEELCDLLEDIAPDDCYFGSHVGDGSDFGFWMLEALW